jgi:hypothetical protein
VFYKTDDNSLIWFHAVSIPLRLLEMIDRSRGEYDYYDR